MAGAPTCETILTISSPPLPPSLTLSTAPQAPYLKSKFLAARNLAEHQVFQKIRSELRHKFDLYLRETGDLKLTEKPALWDYYPCYRAAKYRGWKVTPMPASLIKPLK